MEGKWLAWGELKERFPDYASMIERHLPETEALYCYISMYSDYLLITDHTDAPYRVIADRRHDVLFYEEFCWATDPEAKGGHMEPARARMLFDTAPPNPATEVFKVRREELRAIRGGLQTLLLRVNRLLGED